MADSPAAPQADQGATPVELLFDLVFVFAFVQLSHHLAHDLGWRAAIETGILLAAVLTVWVHTTWNITVVHRRSSSAGVALIVIMGLGLFMNIGVTDAFGDNPWLFVVPLLVIEVGRNVWSLSQAPHYRGHVRQMLAWNAFSSPLWLAGCLTDSDWRLGLWCAAAVVDLVGTQTAHRLPRRRDLGDGVPFDAAHFVERASLFLLIALGETILSTGLTLAGIEFGVTMLAAGALAFIVVVSLWAIIFGASYHHTNGILPTADDPIRVGRYAIRAVVTMVAGLIVLATAYQEMLGAPLEHPEIAVTVVLVAGPLLFLGGHAAYLRAVPRLSIRTYVIAGASLVPIGLVGLFTPPLVPLGLMAVLLAVVASIDNVVLARRSARAPG